ncbi:MAG: hypothetical protein WCW65_02040, partial [Candidatus Paceibacterota bacterium]
TNKKIDSYIIETSKVYLFVEYLENLGIENNVDLVVNSVDVLKTEKNKISVNLNITGDFTNIMKSIATLENSPYNITMTSSYLNKEIFVQDNTEDLKNNLDNKNTQSSIKPSWYVNLKFNVLSI